MSEKISISSLHLIAKWILRLIHEYFQIFLDELLNQINSKFFNFLLF